ncbi:5'-nucleotidase [Trichinella pseudospiralis]|uniref:5'-nucleotidase n=1 Tax=Trichinella pseudospiralis TaxID=6337 RepID=A0A0V0YKT4_TRIPS|nr:5'-nucleotidase [Trichinella pseudospiralis]
MNSNFDECSVEEIEQNACWGGAAKIKAVVDQVKANNRNVLFLDAGDQFQGTLWYTIMRHRPISEIMNSLGYDAMTLGNHEFDNRLNGLVPFIKNLTFPVVSTNVKAEGTELENLIKERLLFNFGNDTIALLGVITPETATLSNPEKSVIFEDEIVILKNAVTTLKQEGINKIIVLSHSGLLKDREICKSVPGVDVIVGGHSHAFLYTGELPSVEVPVGPYPEVYTEFENPCLVVQSYQFGKYLGKLQVEFNDEGILTSWSGQPILLDNQIKPDKEMEIIIDKYHNEVEIYRKEVVGYTDVYIDGRSTSCRLSECNLGNMLTDSLVSYATNSMQHFANSEQWTAASVGIINGGAIRNFIKDKPGQLTMKDMYTIAPFDKSIVILRLYGSDLLAAFEHSVSNFSEVSPHGKFLQVSGIRVVYDLTKPNGNRVQSIQIRCQNCTLPKYEELKKDAIYNVVMSNYMANGGDSYTVLQNAVERIMTDHSELQNAVNYFKTHSPITLGLENRILFKNSLSLEQICSDDSMFYNDKRH